MLLPIYYDINDPNNFMTSSPYVITIITGIGGVLCLFLAYLIWLRRNSAPIIQLNTMMHP